MTQPSLFEPEFRKGRHRKNDRDTSIEGAESVAYRAGSQKARLLEVYVTAYPKALTDEEAAQLAGLPMTSCYWKRCGELRQDGKITELSVTRKGSAGVERILCVYKP
jgi:hypothetical protein